VIKLTSDEWRERFKPIREGIHPETEATPADPNYVWTIVEDTHPDAIVNGYDYINRISYTVTEKPWADDEEYYVVLKSHDPPHTYGDILGEPFDYIEDTARGKYYLSGIIRGQFSGSEYAYTAVYATGTDHYNRLVKNNPWADTPPDPEATGPLWIKKKYYEAHPKDNDPKTSSPEPIEKVRTVIDRKAVVRTTKLSRTRAKPRGD